MRKNIHGGDDNRDLNITSKRLANTAMNPANRVSHHPCVK